VDLGAILQWWKERSFYDSCREAPPH
jgi:hypothetical protein